MENELYNKYSTTVFKNLDKDNINKIIEFLYKNGCDFITDIVEDYLDIFMIQFDLFVNRFNKLNTKYNNSYLKLVSSDMNYLEELFLD